MKYIVNSKRLNLLTQHKISQIYLAFNYEKDMYNNIIVLYDFSVETAV